MSMMYVYILKKKHVQNPQPSLELKHPSLTTRENSVDRQTTYLNTGNKHHIHATMVDFPDNVVSLVSKNVLGSRSLHSTLPTLFLWIEKHSICHSPLSLLPKSSPAPKFLFPMRNPTHSTLSTTPQISFLSSLIPHHAYNSCLPCPPSNSYLVASGPPLTS